MIDVSQFREDIVIPALESVELWSEAAENLVMGTAAQESRFTYVKQIRGPALSFFQVEPATYYDHWLNYLDYQEELAEKILDAIGADKKPDAGRMVWDMRFSAIMCRVHYRRKPDPLPAADDVVGMAKYWKTHYNTRFGRGTVEEFIENYELTR